MNTIKKNDTYNPQAMAGFFGWLRRTVENVVNAIAEVSHNPFFVINIIEDIFDGDGFHLGNNPHSGNSNVVGIQNIRGTFPNITQEVELDPSDLQRLDNWVENNFLPYYTTFFIRFKQFAQTNPSRSSVIAVLNEAEKFITLLTWYGGYINNVGDPIFSPNAIQARSKFILIQASLLKSEIAEFMQSKGFITSGQTVKRNLNKLDFSFLDFNMPNHVSLDVFQHGRNLQDEIASDNDPVSVSDNGQTNNSNSSNESPAENKTVSNLLLVALVGIGVYALVKNSSDADEDEPKD